MHHCAVGRSLRDKMVCDIVAAGHAKNPAVQTALPRHPFVPGVSLDTAYDYRQAPNAVPLPAAGRRPGSSIAPVTVAMMLDQLSIRPGNSVLHIGTGTGYTAALAAKLAGAGQVVSIDREHDLTAQARRTLLALGYHHIEVRTADAHDDTLGVYDRIIVTASAYDIPQAWIHQLAPGGRIVVPLRLRGNTRSIAFQNRNGVLQARDSQPCSLPPMRGRSHDLQRTSAIGPGGRLTLTCDHDQKMRVNGYNLDTPESYTNVHEAWSAVIAGHGESLDSLWPRLAASWHGTCGLTAAGEVPGLPRLAIPDGTPALAAYGSIAYLTRKEIPAGLTGARRYELGAAAYGPFAAHQADTYIEQIRAWDRTRAMHPNITALDADTPLEQLPPGQHLPRPSYHLVISAAVPTCTALSEARFS